MAVLSWDGTQRRLVTHCPFRPRPVSDSILNGAELAQPIVDGLPHLREQFARGLLTSESVKQGRPQLLPDAPRALGSAPDDPVAEMGDVFVL
ncbi:hypothetical protein GCM10010439_21510 [Actinocorallia aurantiaca]|uniref:Uncharacterized protein n=1 Tax=Actinocorallia aurantiaca TaxID=46204 RepID=A0ABN3U573_9ACTN